MKHLYLSLLFTLALIVVACSSADVDPAPDAEVETEIPATEMGTETAEPTDEPTIAPTDEPTAEPTIIPTETIAPTIAPTEVMTNTKISFNIQSEFTGIDYPVDVFLPTTYDESAEPFPVIYSTDGQWLSDPYNEVLFDAGVQAVLVSIHQGPHERRQIDFGFPGAESYWQFFQEELMEMIESEYNVSPEDRTLVGQSAGGAYVWSVMVLQDQLEPVFNQLLIVDHGYWGGWDTLYKDKMDAIYAENPVYPAKLVITGALADWHYQPEDGSPEIVMNFTNEVNALEALFRSYEFEGLEITRFTYEDVPHDEAAVPSFADMVEVYFK